MATSTGIYHTSYRAELRLRHTRAEQVRLAGIFVFLLLLPFMVDTYWLGVVNTILIGVVGALGLNILVGFTGQISLGQGGFLAVGAYTTAVFNEKAGLGVVPSVVIAVLLTAAVGAFFGLPALRLKGLYLAIATLASQQIIVFVVRRWSWLTDGKGYVDVARLEIGPFKVERLLFEWQWYWILVVIAVLSVFAARNLFRSSLGRSFMAVRDQDIAAQAMGINLTRTKVTAFALSSAFVGLAGALTAHYSETVSFERFTLDISILFLAMILVGGLGSVAGTVYGATAILLLSPLLTELSGRLKGSLPFLSEQLPAIRNALFGLVIIVFLLVEPRGLDRFWQRVKDYVRLWPFRY
jgi:branched-chain amino acid transport system permease protein